MMKFYFFLLKMFDLERNYGTASGVISNASVRESL